MVHPRSSFPERYLPLWIFLALGAGLASGHCALQIGQGNTYLAIGTTSLPISFGIILLTSWWMPHRAGASYPVSATLSFSAAGNNLALAIAAALATVGLTHGAAFADAVPCPAWMSIATPASPSLP